MFKNPDLIDKYLVLFINAITSCAWITISIISTIVLWSYILVTYSDLHYGLFTIFDFVVLVIVLTIWHFVIVCMAYSMRDVARAYRSFMES